MRPIEPGTIILLNGTSSSGKSSILSSIQNTFAEPFLDTGIDKFIWMLPKRYLDRPLWDDVLGLAVEAGDRGRSLFSGMHHAIAALSRRGNNVVADHVLVEKAWWSECAGLFHDRPAYLVKVFCPLDVLLEREARRPSRTPGQAQAQFDRVHLYPECDLEVDTSQLTADACARLIYERITSEIPPQAFQQLHQRFADQN